MKNGKTPTLRQKKAIAWAKGDATKWLVVKACDGQLQIVHRDTGKVETIPA